MNIKQAKQEAINAIRSYLLKDEQGGYIIPINRQRPIVFMGPAGIGKTDLANQVADELNIGFLSYTITHHTRQSAVGLPKITTKSYHGLESTVTEYSMSEIISSIYDYIEKNGKTTGVLFIDEFNCASETLAATMLQFLQNKTFGTNKVPDGWKIILAGNPTEYNKSVKELDVVTMDRLRILPIVPDFEPWKEYAVLKNLHPSIISYLSSKQSNFCSFSKDKGKKQIVTPRAWEELSHTIYLYNKLGIDIDHNLITQFVNHERISIEFANYYDIFTNILSDQDINDILDGKASRVLKDRIKKTNFEVHCSVIWILTNSLQTASNDYVKLTSICDEVHSLLVQVKEDSNLIALQSTDISDESTDFISDILKDTSDMTFEDSFKHIKKNFDMLVNKRISKMNIANDFITNILTFIEDTFGSAGEMEMFLNNIAINSSIIKMLIEADNKKYLAFSEQFTEVYKTQKINNRVRQIHG